MTAVSVVIPLHDAAATVAETVASVLGQSFTEWELILVDDASTDDGPDLARAAAAGTDRPVRVLEATSSTPQGPSAARNRGLAVAAGGLVAFLDADDVWAPGFLEARVHAMAADPGVGLVWGPVRYWYPDDPAADFDQPSRLPDRARRFEPRGPVAGWLLDLRATPCPSASLFRRDALEAEAFPEALRRGEDIAAAITTAADRPTAYDPRILVRYRRHARSATSTANRQGSRADDDLAFGTWVLDRVADRPDLAGLRRIAARSFHSLAHRAVEGDPPIAARRRVSRLVLGHPTSRHRWWAVALDWVLPLRWSRRVAARLQRSVRPDLE